MPDFDAFVSRHGEAGAQWLVEAIERREGIKSHWLDLQDRWVALANSAANGNQPEIEQ